GEALELADFLIPRAERAGGEVFPADLPELQARRPDRPLEVGDLEVDHFMAPRLEPPPQGRERIVVTRRGETQDADTTHGSALRPWQPLCPCDRTAPHELRFVHARLSFSRSFVWDAFKLWSRWSGRRLRRHHADPPCSWGMVRGVFCSFLAGIA